MRDLAGTTVLLLEDEFLIAMDAEEILRNMGVERVVVASTFAEAQKAAETNGFDLALLDVNIKWRYEL
jgi:DNA-binding response OmpR family regulator